MRGRVRRPLPRRDRGGGSVRRPRLAAIAVEAPERVLSHDAVPGKFLESSLCM